MASTTICSYGRANSRYWLGEISEAVCQVPVGLNRVGMVLLGGLNPVAAAFEAGFEMENIAESGVVDFNHLTSIFKM